MADDFQAQWRDRLASGSKLASKALAQAAKEDASRVPAVAALSSDTLPTVRIAAIRALATLAAQQPAWVAPHAQTIVQTLGAPEADAQEAALTALGHVASRAPEEAALALPLIAELLEHAKRPALREEAARCLGRIGGEVPHRAPQAAQTLIHHLIDLKTARDANEARETLAALELLLPHLAPDARTSLAPQIAPLRAHPNIQVRERAGRIARALAA